MNNLLRGFSFRELVILSMHLSVILYLLGVTSSHAENSASPLQPAIDDFTLNFIKNRLKSHPYDNIFFSPLSIEIAYSWLMGGCQGSTRENILKILGFMYSDPRIDTPEKINIELGQVIKTKFSIQNCYHLPLPDFSLSLSPVLVVG